MSVLSQQCLSSSSEAVGRQRPVAIQDIQDYKTRGERFLMLTAYDYPTAQILDQAGLPLLLVGDSVGNNVLGYPSTVPVTLDEMVHHAAAVCRGASRALVVGDLPFMSYQASPEDGMRAAGRLLKEAGVTAVKLEGGVRCAGLVARLVDAGIPVMGHIGLTPQSVNMLGYRVQGRQAEGADRLLDDAVALAGAGAFSIVVEAVPAEVGKRITEAVDVPTIGIGAGPHTDGQVLVINDVLGLNAGRNPRFAKAYADLRSVITDAVKSLSAEVASGDYPGPEHSY
ncbi:3-methyl-2-oxobutanoate hydroxymethyltransferase [soil metagenome]